MTIMAYRGIMSGCWILTEEEYTSLREMAFQAEGDRVGDLAAKAEAAAALAEARADAAHWRAEHDRVCQALDAANVRADKAYKEVAQLRSANAALTDQVTQARHELFEALGRPPQPPPPHSAVPLVVAVRVRYLWPAPGQAEAGTEAQGEAAPTPAPPRRVPLHAVRPDERRE